MGSERTPRFLLLFETVILAIGLSFTGCEQAQKPAPQKVSTPPQAPPPPTPTPTPAPTPPLTGRKLRPGVILRSQEAMTVQDISLLLRSATPEADILADLSQRGIVERLDDAGTKRLTAEGASPSLIAALQSWDYVLSETEKERYKERQTKRSTYNQNIQRRMEDERMPANPAADTEKERQTMLQRQIAANQEKARAQQAQKEQAQKDYEFMKASLDKDIERMQQSINWCRSHGYNENALKGYLQRLEEMKEQRSKLSPPPP